MKDSISDSSCIDYLILYKFFQKGVICLSEVELTNSWNLNLPKHKSVFLFYLLCFNVNV